MLFYEKGKMTDRQTDGRTEIPKYVYNDTESNMYGSTKDSKQASFNHELFNCPFHLFLTKANIYCNVSEDAV